MSTRIIIDRIYTEGEYKKYRSTEEQIQQNQRENQLQRQRDEQARTESVRRQDSNTDSDNHSGGRP